jgi:hypothetical protein
VAVRRIRTVAAAAALSALAVLAAAPPGATAQPGIAAQPDTVLLPGTAVRVEPLPDALRLAGSGPAWRLAYVSTSWSGRRTIVTGTLSLPTGRPPRAGWPVISFGHGFSGTADACAHSRTGPTPWERVAQEALLGAGYAVAVSDWEGVGTPAPSPGVHGPAEAYGMIDVVRAARRIAPVSRTWASVGYSQGGHGALFAAWLAPRYAPELRLTGTVALAPTTQWRLLLSSPAGSDPAAPVLPTLPFFARPLQLTTGGAFRPAQWYTPLGLDLAERAERICIEEMAVAVAGLTNADVLRDPAAASAEFVRLFAAQEVPVGRYAVPVRLVHGTADALPAVLSEITAAQLAGAGTDATYTPVDGADHFTLLPQVASRLLGWVDELFAAAARPGSAPR